MAKGGFLTKKKKKKKKKFVKKTTDIPKPQPDENESSPLSHRYGTRKNAGKKRKNGEQQEALEVPIRATKTNKRKKVEDEEELEHDRFRVMATQHKREKEERFEDLKKNRSKGSIDLVRVLAERGKEPVLVKVGKRSKMGKSRLKPLPNFYVDRVEDEVDEETESEAEIGVSEDEDDEEERSSSDEEAEEEDNDDDVQELIQGNTSRHLMARHEDIWLTRRVTHVTHRLAVVNMEWDHIKAVDLYIAISSCLPQGGQIFSVSIYPSEFGLKCMEIEAVRGLFALLDNKEEHSEGETDNGVEMSQKKMRTYELNKLRYYYAVTVFDSSATANHVYRTLDGTKLLRTSNIFDLRFIPDSMKFKHPLADAATEAPTMYNKQDFRSRASQHDKVKLWKDVPCCTKKILKRKINPEQMKSVRRSKVRTEMRSEGSSCSSSVPADACTPPSALGIIGSVPASSATSAHVGYEHQASTAPADDVLPETAIEIARLESKFQVAGPADLGEGEFVPCPSIKEIMSMPLPPHAILEQQRRCKFSELAREAYHLRKHEFVFRYESAKGEREKHTNLERAPRSGRSGNDPKTKRPPKGMRVVVKWNEAALPIGEWGKKFNNYLGCLAKRADYFNPALGWLYQPYRGLEAAWRNIQKYFVLDENPSAWDYVFTAKMPRMLAEWKSTLKKKHYLDYNDDWERFWRLDFRADAIHFAALEFYWETEKSEKKSKQCQESRHLNKFNHHLGSRSYPQLEFKHKKKMRVDEIVRLAYGTFKPTYKNEAKMKENLAMVDALARSINEASLQAQSEGESDSALPQDVQDRCVKNVFGPAKKYKYRFRGVGAQTPKRDKRRKNKQCNASSSSGMSTGTGTGTGGGTTYQELVRRQEDYEKKTEVLKAQNQVMMNFFMELYPDKVDILRQRIAMAVSSLGDASQGGTEAEGNDDGEPTENSK